MASSVSHGSTSADWSGGTRSRPASPPRVRRPFARARRRIEPLMVFEDLYGGPGVRAEPASRRAQAKHLRGQGGRSSKPRPRSRRRPVLRRCRRRLPVRPRRWPRLRRHGDQPEPLLLRRVELAAKPTWPHRLAAAIARARASPKPAVPRSWPSRRRRNGGAGCRGSARPPAAADGSPRTRRTTWISKSRAQLLPAPMGSATVRRPPRSSSRRRPRSPASSRWRRDLSGRRRRLRAEPTERRAPDLQAAASRPKPGSRRRPTPRPTRELNRAVKLTRDAVYAWVNVFTGPALVTVTQSKDQPLGR